MMRSQKVALSFAVWVLLAGAPLRADDEAVDRPTAPPKALPAVASPSPTAKAKTAAKKPAKKQKVKWTEQELQLAPAPLMKPKP